MAWVREKIVCGVYRFFFVRSNSEQYADRDLVPKAECAQNDSRFDRDQGACGKKDRGSPVVAVRVNASDAPEGCLKGDEQ